MRKKKKCKACGGTGYIVRYESDDPSPPDHPPRPVRATCEACLVRPRPTKPDGPMRLFKMPSPKGLQ